MNIVAQIEKKQKHLPINLLYLFYNYTVNVPPHKVNVL